MNRRKTDPALVARSVDLFFHKNQWYLTLDTEDGDRHRFELSVDAVTGYLDGYTAVSGWVLGRVRGRPSFDGDSE